MTVEALLKRVDLFRGLTQVELAEIDAIAERRTCAADSTLVEEGKKGDTLYIIEKGRVRIDLKLTSDSDCATVHRLREGQTLGELSLVDSRRRSATATCETDCEIVAIPSEKLKELFDRDCSIGFTVILNLARIVAERLRKTNLQLVATVCWE